MKHPVTNKHFDEFKREVNRWISLFGLSDWRIYFQQRNLPEMMAMCKHDSAHRVATMVLGRFWQDVKPSPEEIRRTALHEVAHLLCADFTTIALAKYKSQEEAMTAEESLVARLANCLIQIKGGGSSYGHQPRF
jgi:hypothetical protein